MIKNHYVLISFFALSLAGTVIRAMDKEQQRIQKAKRHRIRKADEVKKRHAKLVAFDLLNNDASECQRQVDRLRTNFGQKPYVTTHMLRQAGSLQVYLVHLKHRNLKLENELAGAVERAVLQHVQQRIPAENREKFMVHTYKWYSDMLREEQNDLSKARARQEAKNVQKIAQLREAMALDKELNDELKAQGF
jgi:hypothetical protein